MRKRDQFTAPERSSREDGGNPWRVFEKSGTIAACVASKFLYVVCYGVRIIDRGAAMRFTSVLCATHIGNAFKNIWKVQKQRKVLDFGVRQQLEARGVAVAEALHLAGLAEPAR